MDKKRVCVVGATGSVGQEFIQSLNNHPWFELTQIAASPKSAGKNYLDAIKNADGIVQWEVDGDIPSYVKNMIVKNVDDIDTDNLDLMFSAVESEAARDIETKFAAILPVISTSSMDGGQSHTLWYALNAAVVLMDPYEMHSNVQELRASLPLCYFCSLLHTSF